MKLKTLFNILKNNQLIIIRGNNGELRPEKKFNIVNCFIYEMAKDQPVEYLETDGDAIIIKIDIE